MMVFRTFWVYARFRILFVHIFVPLGSLLRKTKEPTHMEEKKKAQNEQSCRTRITRLLPAEFTQVKRNEDFKENQVVQKYAQKEFYILHKPRKW